MEHLDIGEKRYIKVSSAARETGYTTDYIGQLCRAKKIDAKLVGRTWYVLYDELIAHRQTRGRSSHEKAKKAFKKEVAAIDGETRIPITIEHTGLRKRLVDEQITYHRDESELIPTSLQGKNDEEGSVSKKIVVEKDSHERPVSFNTAEKPEIKWNGTIVIESLNNTLNDEITSNTKAKTTSLTRHIHLRDKEQVAHVDLSVAESPQDPLLQRERFLNRVNRAHDLNTLESALKTSVEAIPEQSGQSEGKISSRYLRIVTKSLVACTVLILAVGLSSFFLEKNALYIAGTDGGVSAPYYQKGWSISSPKEIKNNTMFLISSGRDIFKNKR
jgi:hypothetical protein